MMKSIKLLAVFLLIGVSVQAQTEQTLPFMTDVFQSSYINPAIIPEHKVSVGLPINFGFQTVSDGFVMSEFVRFKTDTTTSININDFYDGLRDKNLIYLGQNADIFHVRFKVQNAFYWFAIREHADASMFYAKDLFSIAMEGTSPFIGKTMDFSNMQFKANAYMEYSLGMSMAVKKWTFGARLSILKGIANVDFTPDKLELEIKEDSWANVARADASLKTAGIPRNSEGEIGIDDGFSFQWLKENVLATKNNGLALSAGATYQVDERLKASFSFHDLGFIKWKSNLETYQLKGEFNLEGIDVLSQFLDDEGFEVDSLVNGFKDAFDTDTIQGSTYKTWLSAQFNLGVSYKLASRTVLNVMFNATYNTRLYPSFTMGISQGAGRFFNLTANISFAHRTLKNFGVGLVVKPGPVQFFVAIDNYYPLLGNEQLLSFTNTTARVGINLVFGRVSNPDGMPLW